MANMITDAETLISDALRDWFAITVEYRRGATTEFAVTMSTGGQSFALINQIGVFGSEQSNDFIVEASSLVLNFGGEPKRGDVIAWTINGTVHLYECSGPGGETPYELHGPNRNRWRIHTKYLGTE